jgi:hypothetical protein
MTTQVHIVNSSDSNPQQHARVTMQPNPQAPEQVFLLAPGESKAFWITGNAEGIGHKITVVEVFAPKPQPQESDDAA